MPGLRNEMKAAISREQHAYVSALSALDVAVHKRISTECNVEANNDRRSDIAWLQERMASILADTAQLQRDVAELKLQLQQHSMLHKVAGGCLAAAVLAATACRLQRCSRRKHE